MTLASRLTPERALIFRITHRDNLPWILENGLHCSNSGSHDPGFVSIGNPDLIDKRRDRPVAIPPRGTLADYVPFYFTPFSPMLLNIHTGRGVQRRSNEELVILIASAGDLVAQGLAVLITDRHAYLHAAQYSSNLDDLPTFVPWAQIQSRDFSRDPEHPEKIERYQAEALVHRHVPADALRGIACYTPAIKADLDQIAAERGLEMKILAERRWYFP
jgi:hypothetical protein